MARPALVRATAEAIAIARRAAEGDPRATLAIQTHPGLFHIPSRRRGGRFYLVNLRLQPPTCSCPWFSNPGNETGTCKHVEIALISVAANSSLGGAHRLG